VSDPAFHRLAEGLALDGFRVRLSNRGASFRGVVIAAGREVKLRLDYSREASEPPQVIVENPDVLPPGVVAHLDEVNELCVVDRSAYLADRYALAEQGRGIVRRAQEILARRAPSRRPPRSPRSFRAIGEASQVTCGSGQWTVLPRRPCSRMVATMSCAAVRPRRPIRALWSCPQASACHSVRAKAGLAR
jgi:hypothetical protein